jgi:hypothetical protein
LHHQLCEAIQNGAAKALFKQQTWILEYEAGGKLTLGCPSASLMNMLQKPEKLQHFQQALRQHFGSQEVPLAFSIAKKPEPSPAWRAKEVPPSPMTPMTPAIQAEQMAQKSQVNQSPSASVSPVAPVPVASSASLEAPPHHGLDSLEPIPFDAVGASSSMPPPMTPTSSRSLPRPPFDDTPPMEEPTLNEATSSDSPPDDLWDDDPTPAAPSTASPSLAQMEASAKGIGTKTICLQGQGADWIESIEAAKKLLQAQLL